MRRLNITSQTSMATLASLSKRLSIFSQNFRNVVRSYHIFRSDSASGRLKASVRWFITGSITFLVAHKFRLGATVLALKSRKVSYIGIKNVHCTASLKNALKHFSNWEEFLISKFIKYGMYFVIFHELT